MKTDMLLRSTAAYREASEYLYGRINFEKSPTLPYNEQHYRLNRMRRLLELLGNPERHAPVLHIAGTKGKGSVSWLLAEAARHAGYRTGLYTSPHLSHLEERWVVDGKAAPPQAIIQGVQWLRPAVHTLLQEGFEEPTFFEMVTAIAWLWFRECHTDINVIEVGLGGRLDSTNVCHPTLTLITSIGFDHQAQLGDTLARIAGEKAGIIKPRIPVVSGAIAPEASAVIELVAFQNDAPLVQLGRDFDVEAIASPPGEQGSSKGLTEASSGGPLGSSFHFHWHPKDTPAATFVSPPLRMLGSHQSTNAGLVCAAANILNRQGWSFSEEALSKSFRETQVSGRIEVRGRHPWMILDTAHNPASMDALLRTLQECFPSGRRLFLFSSSRDKDHARMLEMLLPHCDHLVLTQYRSHARAATLETLMESIPSKLLGGKSPFPSIDTCSDPVQGLRRCLELASPNDLICATGSFFLAAELLESGLLEDR